MKTIALTLSLSLFGMSAMAGEERIFTLQGKDEEPAGGGGPKITASASADLWLATIDGDFLARGQPVSMNAGIFGDSSSADDDDSGAFGLHARGDVAIDRFLFFLDSTVVGGVEEDRDLPAGRGDLNVVIDWFEFGAGFRALEVIETGEGAVRTPLFALDALVGGRITTIDAELDYDTLAEVEIDRTAIEPFVGAQLQWRPAQNLTVRARGDVGGFGAGSDFSWQAAATVGYTWHFRTFSLTVEGGYRALGQNFDDDLGEDLSGWDGVVHGPTAGVTFAF